MEIKTTEIINLVLDPNNARKHSERNLKAIVASLEKFGQRKPIVVSAEGTVLAGNGTVLAATQLGWTTIEVAVAPADWDAQMLKAYALADNRTAELAEWDEDVLERQLEELRLHDFDVDLLAFGDEYSTTELDTVTGDEVDDVPEPPKDPISKPGDVWLLGRHKLICGDSTDDGVYAKLMGEEQAEMMFTDPPWNVAIGKDSNPRHRQREGLENDDLAPEKFAEFLRNFAESCFPYIRGDVYCVLGASEWPTLDTTLRSAGFHWSATVIWVKDLFVLGRSKYHRRYEPIWYGWRKDLKSSFQNRRDLDDVWEIPRPRKSEEHPTMKPVELMVMAINNSSASGSIVLDPFGGSGSTLMACEQTGRACRTIELEPRYVDVICRRYQQFTGVMPKLEATGEDYNFILAES